MTVTDGKALLKLRRNLLPGKKNFQKPNLFGMTQQGTGFTITMRNTIMTNTAIWNSLRFIYGIQLRTNGSSSLAKANQNIHTMHQGKLQNKSTPFGILKLATGNMLRKMNIAGMPKID